MRRRVAHALHAPAALAILMLALVSSAGPGMEAVAAPGETQLDPAASKRIEEVRRLVKESGHPDEAQESARRLVADLEKAFGPGSLETAEALDVLSESLWRAGVAGAPEAREAAERAVRIKEGLAGLSPLRLAASVSNLGWAVRVGGSLAESRPHFERALALREEALGPDHIEVGWSLEALGSLLDELGDYGSARPHLERALRIAELRWGAGHHELAPSLYTLAGLLLNTGEYAQAAARHEEALSIERREHPEGHFHTAWVLNGLANVLKTTGRLGEARASYEESLAIARAGLSANDPFLDSSLNNLALLLEETGDLVEARRMMGEILARRQAAPDPDLRMLAQSEINLAKLLIQLGEYGDARGLLESALARREAVLPAEHPEIATCHLYLADLLSLTGELDLAERHYARAREITSVTLGESHADVARVMAGQAANRVRMGRAVSAGALYRRALDVMREALGARHPEVAAIEIALASALAGTETGPLPRDLLADAESIYSESLGPGHPRLAAARATLARVAAREGSTEESLEAALSAEQIGRDQVRLTAQFLPEGLALRYAALREPGLDIALGLAAEGLPPEGRRTVLDAVVRSRALILDEMVSRRAAAHASSDPATAKLWESYAAASARLAYLVVTGPAGVHPGGYPKLLDESRREKEKAAEALAKASAAFRADEAAGGIGLEAVEKSLPPRSALVAFSVYETTDPRTRSWGAEVPRACLAFVLREGDRNPAVVPLGDAARIDRLVAAWRGEVASERLRRGEAGDEKRYRVEAAALREAVWDPVASHLEGADLIFVVPAGPLNLVNLSALPIGRSGYLVEKGPLIQYVSAERDLTRPAARAGTRMGLLAVGGVSFDGPLEPGAGSTGALAPAAAAPAVSGASRAPGPIGRGACAALESERFPDLPATAEEVREVARIWRLAAEDQAPPSRSGTAGAWGPAAVIEGREATEKAFREQAPGKRVVHLATHGFFLGERCAAAGRGARGVTGLSSPGGASMPLSAESSLLFTGVALAGANQRSRAASGETDAILTAEEIASMDLSGVEWAVLSACDTGAGLLRADEGVFGLRRAFQVAGAATVIMSLWPVRDEDAREWMVALYRTRLLDGATTAEAIRQASSTVLRRRREGGASTHPFHWAAFVGAGDWR